MNAPLPAPRICVDPVWLGDTLETSCAQVQTERFNQVATERKESWLSRYGGIIA